MKYGIFPLTLLISKWVWKIPSNMNEFESYFSNESSSSFFYSNIFSSLIFGLREMNERKPFIFHKIHWIFFSFILILISIRTIWLIVYSQVHLNALYVCTVCTFDHFFVNCTKLLWFQKNWWKSNGLLEIFSLDPIQFRFSVQFSIHLIIITGGRWWLVIIYWLLLSIHLLLFF